MVKAQNGTAHNDEKGARYPSNKPKRGTLLTLQCPLLCLDLNLLVHGVFKLWGAPPLGGARGLEGRHGVNQEERKLMSGLRSHCRS